MAEDLPQTDEEWRQRLSDEQFLICRQKGTEPPFSGALLNHKEDGSYRCVCCGQALFSSATKFDSGSGWPSFFQPLGKNVITETLDVSHGMKRVEISCGQCGAHLGHVFTDGPQPTGLRYCVNSVSLEFTAEGAAE